MRRWRNVLWFAVWTVGGFLFGWAGQAITGSAAGVLVGLVAGVLTGSVAWFVAIAVRALGTWVDPNETVGLVKLLRTDRTTALREGLAFGLSVSTVMWLVIWLLFEASYGLPFGVVYGNGVWVLNWLVTAAAAALGWMLFGTMFGPWLIARLWLPLTGQLPWSVMEFLADAHRCGVLRQAGGVYQFRHARLQNHLAATGAPQ